MKHLVDTPRGRNARNTTELMESSLPASPMKKEVLSGEELFLCWNGFYVESEYGMARMTEDQVKAALFNVFRLKPTARMWDFIPEIPYKEEPIVLESPEIFNNSFNGRAEFIAREFSRRPNMVGFRIELHNVDGQEHRPTMSVISYESTEDLTDVPCVPLSCEIVSRRGF